MLSISSEWFALCGDGSKGSPTPCTPEEADERSAICVATGRFGGVRSVFGSSREINMRQARVDDIQADEASAYPMRAAVTNGS